LGTRKQQQSAGITLRRTAAQDLDSVVALDAANVGRARQVYFERRLKSALAQPAQYVQFSAEQNGRFAGFIMARRLLGEFGRAEPAFRLEAMGVAQDEQGKGIGTALLAKIESEAKRMGVPVIRSTASWRDHTFMRFFDRGGIGPGRQKECRQGFRIAAFLIAGLPSLKLEIGGIGLGAAPQAAHQTYGHHGGQQRRQRARTNCHTTSARIEAFVVGRSTTDPGSRPMPDK
jgi:GNAT superfamily N-acetyltransferase